MINYSKGKIYKIIGPEAGGLCYIGSTTKQYLSQRLAKHRSNYRQWKNGSSKETKVMSYELFDKYGEENCKIILLENVNVSSKDELHVREQFYIDANVCVNKKRAFRTAEQTEEYYVNYRKTNKPFILEQNHKYYDDNKEQILQKQHQYYEKNKQRVRERNEKNKDRYQCSYCEFKSFSSSKLNRHKKTNRHAENFLKHLNKWILTH
ncbi:hypothetical protein [Clostridium sp.]|uniref:hypothetical protein n=1 Tax=Clostridium sp. TaxID=1506 RepID=UPI00283BD49A|nr:hypothetical protein [Clostridium sp.]MDR3597099.1 hypothetical protein [Clostridium sp.]